MWRDSTVTRRSSAGLLYKHATLIIVHKQKNLRDTKLKVGRQTDTQTDTNAWAGRQEDKFEADR
jgi:hypothetical protein